MCMKMGNFSLSNVAAVKEHTSHYMFIDFNFFKLHSQEVHTCVHIYTYAHTHTHTCMYTCAHPHMHACTHTHACKYAQILNTHTHTHTLTLFLSLWNQAVKVLKGYKTEPRRNLRVCWCLKIHTVNDKYCFCKQSQQNCAIPQSQFVSLSNLWTSTKTTETSTVHTKDSIHLWPVQIK